MAYFKEVEVVVFAIFPAASGPAHRSNKWIGQVTAVGVAAGL